MVSRSASSWVGWNSLVRPFHTGTPAYCAGLYHFLAVAAVLNAVVHPSEHAGGVLDRLFMANLAAAGPQIGHAGALIVCGNFERASCTG